MANNKPKIVAIPDSDGNPAFAMSHSDGVKVKEKGTLTGELTAIRNGLDKAFNNWEDEEGEVVPVVGDEVLYEQQVSANLTLQKADYPILQGEHIRFTFENGNGEYVVWMYAESTQNAGKTSLGSVTDEGVIDIPSFYYPSGYDHWGRFMIIVPSAVKIKLERLAPDSGDDSGDDEEPVGISLSSVIKKEVNDMIDEKLADFTPPEEEESVDVDSAFDATSENPLQNKVITKEKTIINDGLNRAFENWRIDPADVETLYSGTTSRTVSIDKSSKSISAGDHIMITVEGGSGTYEIYEYLTTGNTDRFIIGSIVDNGKLYIDSFPYQTGYNTYNNIKITVPSAATIKVERYAQPYRDISFKEVLRKEMVSTVLSNDGIKNAIDKTIFNGVTSNITVNRTDSAFLGFTIGDYLKIVVGSGTGSWEFNLYYNSTNSPKIKKTYSNTGTYYFKIPVEFNRMVFTPSNGTDMPLSVTLVSSLKADIVEVGNAVIDTDFYYNKGQSNNFYSKLPCIVIAGQSNADGRVLTSELPEYITLPNDNVQVWGSSSFSALSTDYYASNKGGQRCFGFDMIMLHYLSQITDCYVVKRAVGGTSLSSNGSAGWTPDYEKLSTSYLRELETRIRNAASASSAFDIRAIVWHQGEADNSPSMAVNYYTQLKRLIAYIRGVCGNPTLPFIGGTISHNSSSYSAIVESAMLKVAAEDNFVTFIDMSGATHSDGVHLDLTSAEYLGKKVYDALIDYGVISGTKLNPACPWEV